jgi:ribosome-associated toxin RatA of RatAB toxin-antitoxin module
MHEIRRSAIVEHSVDHLHAVVADVAAYPSFLPWCLAASVGGRTDEGIVATMEVGIRGLRQRFSTLYRENPPTEIDIRLVDGPFRHLYAHWQFKPLGERAAKIDFAMDYEFSGPAVSKLLGPLFEHIADTMVDAFTRRADALQGKAVR